GWRSCSPPMSRGRATAAARSARPGGRSRGWRRSYGWWRAVERFAAGLRYTPAEVNGAPGLAAWAGDTLAGVVAFDVRDGLIAHLRIVVNPDKLDFVRRQLARS